MIPDALVRVADVAIKLEAYDWPFLREQRSRIDAHWASRIAMIPSLYDGRVLLTRNTVVEKDVLRGSCFEVPYRGFLAWRDFGFPGEPVINCFAMPALLSADGAFLLGEMSAETANPGLLYFPAGTPEPSDLGADGCIDFDSNVHRELEEETGLTAEDIVLEPNWTLVFAGPRLACMKMARTSLDASILQGRLDSYNAGQKQPELTRLVPVRTLSDLDPVRMPDFMLRFLASALED